ncbi:YwqG family protein [Phenylobacterium sp.]|uniref:YwqG family protein n=1 Tax=Phenylobacterium sp. TaxID=1871053 RepID=UPI0030F490F6
MTVFGVACAALIVLVLAGAAFQGWREGRGGVRRRKTAQSSGKGPSATALRRELKALARPTLLLLPAEAAAFSKLGGAPDLEASAAWPTSTVTYRYPKRDVTTSMGFVAQLDLAEVRAAGGSDWLPDQGRLYFFAEPWMGAALHVATPYDAQPLIVVPALPKGFPLPERRVAMTPATSYPDLEWLVEDLSELDIEGEALERLSAFPTAHMPTPEHRVGGHPSPIQSSDMELECERMLAAHEGREPADLRPRDSDWRLLLQVDTDDELKTRWGDGGRLYYWIREADARAGDFSKIQMVGQSH